MIETAATLQRLQGQQAWVLPPSVAACARCAEGRGCGGGLILRLAGTRKQPIPVHAPVSGLQPGDTVIVGLPEFELVRAAAWTYLLPLGGLLLAAGLAHGFGLGEATVVLAALSGLGSGLLWLRLRGAHGELPAGRRPVILRRVNPSTGDCARQPA